MNDLKTIWNELAYRHTDNNDLVETLWEEIEKHYTKKKRFYHNLVHLDYMIVKANEHKHAIDDFDVFLFSIFYHDIVYNVKKQDNETRSAEIAKERLIEIGLDLDLIGKCHEQIVATKDHIDSDNNVTNMLVDIDLAILGEDNKTYVEYTKKIRKEYSIYPDFLYNKGRKKALQHFLEMDTIFKTELFQSRYESLARENMQLEVQSL